MQPIPIVCPECRTQPTVRSWDDARNPRYVHCPHKNVYALRLPESSVWITSCGVNATMVSLARRMGVPGELETGEMRAALDDLATRAVAT